MQNRRPMTAKEIELARQQIEDARNRTYSGAGGMPRDIGEGLTALGDSIQARMLQNRVNQQFPAAPGGAQPVEQTPLRRIVEALSGNRAPWQFPTAPSPPAQQEVQPSLQPGAIPGQPETAKSPFAAVQSNAKGFFGFGGSKKAGGLY